MKGYKLYMAIGCLFLIIYLVAQYNRPEAINWDRSLKQTDKIPYGTYVLYDQLNQIYPGADISKTNKSATEVFADTATKAGNYLIIAKSVKLNKADFKALIKYIKAGNSVFIAALDWKGFVADTLKLDPDNEFNRNNPGLNFTNPGLHQADDYIFDNNISNDFFKKFDTLKAVILGKNEFGHATYLKYPYGTGNLYLFANPLTLTNYSILTTPGGTGYGATALSYLPKAKHVYWDQYQNHDLVADDSQLRVLFAYPALQWAYYVALLSLLLFVIYEVKRRQRVIPVIEPLKNSTLEFVSVVGRVYYEQRNNATISFKKITYLSEHLRTVFNLKPGSYEQDFVPTLLNKTGIDGQLASELSNHINYLLPRTQVSDPELILLNQLIEKFYLQSGSYGK